ncbi:hypothetical protein FB561_5822 [Kribbella amoyensis]|uniref:Uncharacterized protein n=1 Tax=Kribbella amoyensis TaxID=996641 RepID=A0A561C0M9_9ACTN|nr:hypothetical protein [Kribbella amoyensis]TWD84628.1 hypothetical protein FB561_5822 [Kribbella amoyensis]
MRTYRVAWWGFSGVVGTAGAMAALTLPRPTVLVLFGLAAVTGGVLALIVLTPGDNRPIRRDQWPAVFLSAGLAGGGAVAFVGLGTLLGAPIALLLLAGAVGGSPYLARHWLRILGGRRQLPRSGARRLAD